jgi:hypothetical protein
MNARRHGLLLLGVLVLAFFLEIYSVHGFTPRQQEDPSTSPLPDDRPKPPTALDTSPPPWNPSPLPGTLGIARFHLDRYAAEPLEKAVADIVKTFNALVRSFVRLPATMGLATPLQVVQNSPRNKAVEFFEPDGYPPEPWSRLKEVTSTEYVYETAWGEYRFSKTLPVFRYFSHEEGYCRLFDEAGETCLDFYSNRPYNTTSAFWLLLGGSYGLPAGYTVWRADDTVFQAEARVARLTSAYAMRMTWNFTHTRYGPKITVEVWKVSGPTRDFQVVWAGLARGVVDALGLDVGSLGGVDTPLGMRTGLRLSFQEGMPDTWSQYLRVDWGDEGPAETWLANVSILGLSFYGWLVRFGLNDALIDPGVNVFGPNTVNPGFNSTGEKTLLTMSTTLPAGGKNVILFSYMENFAFHTGGARGVLRIKKGTTIIYETKITEVLNDGGTQARPKLVIAVDDTPSGNDVYVATLNITTAGSATGSIHVQAIVIKAGDAVWGYNTTGVNIASGATATVTSISTNYPSGSKVAIIGAIYGGRSTGTGRAYMGIGSNRLKSGGTVVASNEFDASSYSLDYINSWVSLQYLETTSTSSQTYSLEVSNGGGVQVTMYGIIVAFTVGDGAFLDTASVSLTSGSQVTVGSLSTTLAGDVVAIGLATDNFTGTSDAKGFDPGDVVLQHNNSVTGQIANQVSWYVVSNIWPGTLPLFRVDTNVTNPSYQIKMTARVTNLSGEAKILAFVPKSGQTFTVSLTETLTASDALARTPNYVRVLAETLTASDSLQRLQTLARTITQTLTASDTLARIPNYIRLIAETLTASDTLSRTVTFVRNLAETMTASDTLSRVPTFVRNLSEALTASDTLTRTAAYVRTIAETVGITSTAFPGAALIALAETILIAESLQVIRIPAQPTPPPGPSGPPIQIPLPTPQQVFPIGLAVALGVVFAGAVYGVQRRRSMGAVMARATQRRPRLKGVKTPKPRFRGFRLGMRRWKAGKMPRRRRWRDSLGE